jgi:predicted transcriptional regulator
MRYICRMKSSTIPAVRVEPGLREQLEQVLQEGETLSSFVEASVRDTVRRRIEQTEFVARGMASLDAAKRTGQFVDADVVVAKLQARLDKSRTKDPRPTSAKG